MPIALADLAMPSEHVSTGPLSLPFPPLTRRHILNCSYHAWYPRYRSITPKARLMALPPAFISYLRADGIVLPPEPLQHANTSGDIDTDSGIFSASDSQVGADDDSSDEEDEESDPSAEWSAIHAWIQATIKELRGAVYPKLNWSAPKDAIWINAGNTMECRSANDVYLLLKSSDFVTHDLEQAFHGCLDSKHHGEGEIEGGEGGEVPYHLVLRQRIPAMVTSLEFRCFVRERKLLCICQRDLNHFDFLEDLLPSLRPLIQRFFDEKLRDTFPSKNFVFDIYVPPPHEKCWLIDINPWAVRTDPLLFRWMEILDLPAPDDAVADKESSGQETDIEDLKSKVFCQPIIRLVQYGDPEAYGFNSSRYSAHKLPKDVVDASLGNVEGDGGLRAFMKDWREVMKRQEAEEKEIGDERLVENGVETLRRS